MRLTLAGDEVSAGNPLPTAGAVVGDVDVVQAVAADLNAVVHGWDGAATQRVLVAANGRLQVDTPALSSTSSSITAEPVAGTFSVAQSTASNLNATVTQAGTVTVDGLEVQAAVVESPNDTAVYPIAAPCRVYGVYFSHDNGTLLQSLALYDSTSGVTNASTSKISLMLPSGKTHDDFGTGNYLAFSSGVAVRCVAAISPSATTAPSANTHAVIIYRLV
jgi:hypothetical protein